MFGADGIDYAMLHKLYGADPNGECDSAVVCTGIDKRVICGEPDDPLVSTSARTPPRTGMRRFTRLTNGFSKKVENLARAASLHFMQYNFVRKHQSLKTTPPGSSAIRDRSPSL